MSTSARSKVYIEGSRTDVRVPFTEVTLADSPGTAGLPVPNAPHRLYDTSGPGGTAEEGLAPLRATWVDERGDVQEYTGRKRALSDDGRSAVRHGAASAEWRGTRRAPCGPRPATG